MQIQCSHCTLVQRAPADVCKRCGHSFRTLPKNRKQKAQHNLFVAGLIVMLILIGGGVYLKTTFPGAISSLLGTASSNISHEDLSIMGEAPSILELSGIFNQYLKPRLADFDSSEYVSYSAPTRTDASGGPYWLSTLKLKTKDASGASVLKNVEMLIRHNQVIFANGL